MDQYIKCEVHMEICHEICSILKDKKASDVTIFDLRGRDYISDFVILATSMAGRHSFALLDDVKKRLKLSGVEIWRVDLSSEDWLIVDSGEMLIHLFTEEYRARYGMDSFLQDEFGAIVL